MDNLLKNWRAQLAAQDQERQREAVSASTDQIFNNRGWENILHDYEGGQHSQKYANAVKIDDFQKAQQYIKSVEDPLQKNSQLQQVTFTRNKDGRIYDAVQKGERYVVDAEGKYYKFENGAFTNVISPAEVRKIYESGADPSEFSKAQRDLSTQPLRPATTFAQVAEREEAVRQQEVQKQQRVEELAQFEAEKAQQKLVTDRTAEEIKSAEERRATPKIGEQVNNTANVPRVGRFARQARFSTLFNFGNARIKVPSLLGN